MACGLPGRDSRDINWHGGLEHSESVASALGEFVNDEIARRTVVKAAWAAPVVMLAIAAPAAAASTITQLELITYTNPLLIPEGQIGDSLPLIVRNNSTVSVTATVEFVMTGMSADGFKVQPLTAAGWTITQTDDFSPITFTWSGTLASGGVSVAQNASFNYVGSASRPFTAAFPCVPGDASITALTLSVTAL
jgi:hypothetical protein